jgi:hypothetical protein
VGSESKLPRYLVGGCSSSWGRLLLLLRSLDWVGFVRKFAGMTTRGMLILSTYTTANLVAAKGGTAMMAAHQVRSGVLLGICKAQMRASRGVRWVMFLQAATGAVHVAWRAGG